MNLKSMDQTEIDNIIRTTLEKVSMLRGINAKCLPFLLLRLKVGNNKYKEIISAVNEIKGIRRTGKAWISLDFHSAEGLSLKQVMPNPMYDIYFTNDLFDAFYNLSKPNISKLEETITRTPWINHLEFTKKNLLEYEMIKVK